MLLPLFNMPFVAFLVTDSLLLFVLFDERLELLLELLFIEDLSFVDLDVSGR